MTPTQLASSALRPRGRPLKEDDQQSKKRARLRRAQHAFRIRKQAAQEAQDRRLVTLESVVEQMSSIFMEFADWVIHSEELHNHPHTLQKLFDTTKKFTALARETNIDSVQKDLSSDGHEIKPDDIETKQLLALSSSSPLDLSSAKSTMDAVPSLENSNFQDLDLLGFLDFPDSSLQSINLITPNSTHLASHIVDPFSIPISLDNGWFGHLPAPFTNYTGPSFTPDFSFQIGLKLLQNTLYFAYDALRGALPSQVSQRIFGLALLTHSKEELLYNLRWFLGPGYSEIYRLGNVSQGTGPVGPVSAPHRVREIRSSNNVNQSNILNVEEDEYMNHSEDGNGQYLDAFGVEDYLRQKGARYVDLDILELSLPNTPNTSSLDDLGEETVQFGDKDSFLSPETSALTGILKSEPHSRDRKDFGLLEIFDFNALLRDFGTRNVPLTEKNHSSIKPAIAKSRAFRVNSSLLLANLASISICLETGPGFPRAYLEHAIELSVVG